MMPDWWRRIILLIFFLSEASGAFVGINIGTGVSNMPPASSIVSILQSQKITHVRLFDADHQMLTALANTGIEVMVGVPNDQLLQVGESRTAAADWINKNVAAFVPLTNITYIAVGNEVLTTIPNAALVLVPAMQFLRSALLAANLDFEVKVSSPQSMDMIPKSFPPSAATFNSTWNDTMSQYLQFLKKTGSSFMLNAQPYYGYINGQGIFPLDYALFQSLNPNNQIVDPNSLLSYNNMFDAMVDAAYYSMQALNFSSIPVLVTATGWPWLGGDNESDATSDNALTYNSNLMLHVLNGSGPPSQPTVPVNTYIHELFNEDLRPGVKSEKYWGVFNPNGSMVYSLDFLQVNGVNANSPGSSGMFCVAMPSANPTALKQGLDWACGPGAANCSAIQPGQPCFVSGDIVPLASYAYNDYYHRTKANGGTCNFGNTATITTVDPSHGACIFAGSGGSGTNSSTGTGGGGAIEPGTALGPSGFINGDSAPLNLKLSYLAVALFLLCFSL